MVGETITYEELANRVGNSLRHSLELCGGGHQCELT